MTYVESQNEVIIAKNDYLRLDDNYYKYIGDFKCLKDVPEEECLFTISGYLYVRRIDYNRLLSMRQIEEPKIEIDNSDELDLTIKPGDDSALIILKELLKGYTKKKFRALFDNDSDYNNARRALEKSQNGQISLNRFRDILTKLGLKYKFIVYSEEKGVIDLNENNESDS